jgi:hypothetical protein
MIMVRSGLHIEIVAKGPEGETFAFAHETFCGGHS